MILRCVLFGILVSAQLAFASDAKVLSLVSARGRTLRYGFVNSAPPQHKQSVIELVSMALTFVQHTAPDGLRFEQVMDGQRYDFIIEVVESNRIEKDLRLHRMQGAIMDSNLDAYTLVPEHAPKGPFILRLLWDRLVFEKQGSYMKERPDALSRMISAVIHEIHGNVVSFVAAAETLGRPDRIYADKFTQEDQIRFEIAAWSAGVRGLEKALERFGSRLPEKTRKDLENQLVREKRGLAGWLKAGGSSSGTTAASAQTVSFESKRCEALFVQE